MEQEKTDSTRMMLRLESTEKKLTHARKLYYRTISFSLLILVIAPITLAAPLFPIGTIIMGVMLAIGISQALQFRNRLIDLKIEKDDLMAEELEVSKIKAP